jgi:hypothetical protein
MKCLYCQQDLLDIPYESKDREFFNPRYAISKAICQSCQVVFRFNPQNIISITWSNIKVKDKIYSIKIWDPGELDQESFSVFYGSYDLNSDQDYSILPLLIKFDFIPNWIPQNIINKLLTFLPFI